jgi:hypothetical protein
MFDEGEDFRRARDWSFPDLLGSAHDEKRLLQMKGNGKNEKEHGRASR